MVAKEWRRRINKAMAAASIGDPSLIVSICNELERLTEPPPLPPPVVELKAVTPPEDFLKTVTVPETDPLAGV